MFQARLVTTDNLDFRLLLDNVSQLKEDFMMSQATRCDISDQPAGFTVAQMLEEFVSTLNLVAEPIIEKLRLSAHKGYCKDISFEYTDVRDFVLSRAKQLRFGDILKDVLKSSAKKRKFPLFTDLYTYEELMEKQKHQELGESYGLVTIQDVGLRILKRLECKRREMANLIKSLNAVFAKTFGDDYYKVCEAGLWDCHIISTTNMDLLDQMTNFGKKFLKKQKYKESMSMQNEKLRNETLELKLKLKLLSEVGVQTSHQPEPCKPSLNDYRARVKQIQSAHWFGFNVNNDLAEIAFLSNADMELFKYLDETDVPEEDMPKVCANLCKICTLTGSKQAIYCVNMLCELRFGHTQRKKGLSEFKRTFMRLFDFRDITDQYYGDVTSYIACYFGIKTAWKNCNSIRNSRGGTGREDEVEFLLF